MRTWDSQHRLSVRALSADLSQREISPAEANYWWRKNDPAGALLNNLMFLFIVVPIVLVLKSFYALSFVVFAMMVPYGLFLRRLAIYAPECLQIVNTRRLMRAVIHTLQANFAEIGTNETGKLGGPFVDCSFQSRRS